MTSPVRASRRRASLSRLALVAAMLVGCTADRGDAGSRIDQWVAHAREAIAETSPDSDAMQIDPGAKCALENDLEIAGKHPELFGAGVAKLGEVGTRYQCAWSGDTNASANVRLEIALLDDAASYTTYAASFRQRDGNTTVPSALGDIEVVITTTEGAPPVGTALLANPDEHAGIHLVVELLDLAAATTWTAADYARMLEDLAT